MRSFASRKERPMTSSRPSSSLTPSSPFSVAEVRVRVVRRKEDEGRPRVTGSALVDLTQYMWMVAVCFLLSLSPSARALRPSTHLLTRSLSVGKMSSHRRVCLEELRWLDLGIAPAELRPANTLTTGQCFNWKRLFLSDGEGKGESDAYFAGVLLDYPLIVRQRAHTTEVAPLLSLHSDSEESERELLRTLHDYFQSEHSLASLYAQWAQRCDRMSVIAERLPGVRVLRQDPWECLLSFLCSSNNNIARITLMLDRLRASYGRFLCSLTVRQPCVSDNTDNKNNKNKNKNKDSVNKRDIEIEISTEPPTARFLSTDENKDDELQTTNQLSLYSFPSAEALSAVSEEELRALGMGYRAKFITGSVRRMCDTMEGPQRWLQDLRAMGTRDRRPKTKTETETEIKAQMRTDRLRVQEALLELPGVGRKVADCVAVFSLDQTEAVPVDTHVWQIALRDYEPGLQTKKSLTPTVYEEVGDVFRTRFQQHAGWAHSVLFAAELAGFREQLPLELQKEMQDFAAEQKLLKTQQTQQKQAAKKAQIEKESSNEDEGVEIPKKRRKSKQK